MQLVCDDLVFYVCFQSAAALCIGVGSFCDAPDIPGLAHFLEHSRFIWTFNPMRFFVCTAILSESNPAEGNIIIDSPRSKLVLSDLVQIWNATT